jgi:hypothetical protein
LTGKNTINLEQKWRLFFITRPLIPPLAASLTQRITRRERARVAQGDDEPADYALVWHPPVEMLRAVS